MNLYKILCEKLYYRFWNRVLKRSDCEIPDSLRNTKNVFIYFDYEREFGGHYTKITDENVEYLVKILNINSIKSTWFTVGKVMQQYPISVDYILHNGHEIGSHTFSHLAPFETACRELTNDFYLFSKEIDKHNFKINGFHSPRGRWAYKSYKLLRNYHYNYEVVGKEKTSLFTPYYLTYWPGKHLFRLQTAGDDWPLFRDKIKNKTAIFDYFIGLSKQIGIGEVGGIGFHPWILFSNENYLKAFEEFLRYLSQQSNVKLETAFTYHNLCKKVSGYP
jgi:peptidoglycan-N-acetylglucosamine deacetylase